MKRLLVILDQVYQLQMYHVLQLFTSLFKLNTNIFTTTKFIKTIYTQTQKLLKMPSILG
jgi:hypothetical protein